MSTGKLPKSTGNGGHANLRKGGGRKKGVPNKMTASVKQALSIAFEGIGGVTKLQEWGKEKPGEFYALWCKLLPKEVEVSGKDGGAIAHTVTVRFVKP